MAARAERLRARLAEESPELTVDVGAGLERLRRGMARTRPYRHPGSGLAVLAKTLGGRRRRLQLALAVSLVLTLVTGVASGWADNLIVVFRHPSRVVVVPVRPPEAGGLLALAGYGNLSYSRLPISHHVADARAAEAEVGFAPLEPGALPAGGPGPPTFLVQPAYTVTFTFDARKASDAARQGTAAAPTPADIDGASIVVDVGAAVFAEYGPNAAAPPRLATVRMRAPTVRTTGVSIAQIKRYLLSRPDLSPALAARLQAIDDGHTLPLLVLSPDGTVQPVQVQGGPASLVTGSSHYGTGIAWVRDGFLLAVYGSSSVDDLRTAADGAH